MVVKHVPLALWMFLDDRSALRLQSGQWTDEVASLLQEHLHALAIVAHRVFFHGVGVGC